MAWLDSVNRERERRGATRLERCVLSTGGDVFRVPWEDVVYPQFINRPRTSSHQERESSAEDSSHDSSSSRKEVKLLPFPNKPSQSAVSSDDEDSEGEYVELTELPALPRFSPQKGSLTQSISLQHRTRTTAHTNTHSSTTHSNKNTHSCSHTLRCSKLLEENFCQDYSGVPPGPSVSSSAPPDVQEQTEGTASGGSPSMHAKPESCTQHGEGKQENKRAGEEEQGREEEKEAKNGRHEGLESDCGEKEELREERLQQLKETERRSEEEEGERDEAEVEEEVESQGRQEEVMKIDQKEGEVEEKETGCEEYIGIDFYSEINKQLIHSEDFYSENLMRKFNPEDSYCKNMTENTCQEDVYCESISEKTKQDSCCENFTEKILPEDSYSENISEKTKQGNSHFGGMGENTHPGGSYTEKLTQKTNLKDFYSENVTEKMYPEDSNCENMSQTTTHTDFQCKSITEREPSTECYFENITQKTMPVSSVSENETHKTVTDDFYSDSTLQTQSEDSYFEIGSLQIPSELERLNSGHVFPEEFKTVPGVLKSEDSYSEDPTQQTQLGDSYSENLIQPEDSYYENRIHENSYSKTTGPEDSYSEKQKQPGDSSVNQIQPEDSYSENSTQLLPEDSNSENPTQAHSDDSYSENLIHQKLEDSYSENPTQTQSDDSYSENLIQQKQLEDSCSENPTQLTLPEDSYSENPTQTQSDSFCENLMQQLVDSCSENPTQLILPMDSYSGKKNQPEDSSENQIQPEESYSENPAQLTLPEDSYSENLIQPEYSYSENPTEPEHSYSEKQTQHEDSYCENQIQTGNSYSEDPAQSKENQTEPHPVFNDGQENGDEQKNKEKEEEQVCDKSVGRRSADHQAEGSSCECPPVQLHISAGSGPEEPEKPFTSLTESSQSRFQSVLLRSGAVCLPGTRDRAGRVLLTISTSNPVWSNPDCDSAELLRLLLYYTSTLRAETRAMGLTVLVDAQRDAPGSALFSALRTLQEETPGSIHSVLLLASKDSSLHLDKAAPVQVEVLSSLKSLQRHVELQQLPAEFGGSLSFSQSSWISFRSRVEQLTKQCTNVINLLRETISSLQSTPLPAAAEDAELLLSTYRAVMSSTLKDVRLVQLQQEGGASVAWLRREEVSGVSEDQRAAVEMVSSLYDQVDELLHRLVTLSNSKMQELSFILEFRSLEQGFSQVRVWLDQVGEPHLKALNEPADSLELLNRKQQDFKEFYTTAYDHCKQGQALLTRLERWDDVSSPDLHTYEVKVHSFWAQLQDFSQRVKGTEQNIERAVQLYRFLDQAYGWALEGMRHLAGISMEDCTLPDKCHAVIGCLEDYQSKHPPIPESRFLEMKAEAGELRGERGLRQWSFAWSKCQETKKMFDRKMEAALRTRDSAHRRRSDSVVSTSSTSSRRSGLWGIRETSSCLTEKDTSTSPPTPQRTPFLRRLLRSSSSYEESERQDVCSPIPNVSRLSSSPSFTPSFPSFLSSSSSSRRQLLRKTQSFDCPSTPDVSRCDPCPRTLSEPPRRGNTGVFIRGLEVSSTEAADRTLCPRTPVQGWAGPRSPGTPGGSTADGRPRGSKLRHIVEEMVTTEREYVRSLQYIIHHYFPEMERADLPQDLRGKRSVIFGNLEKLLDFHSQFFLRELEACWKHPLRVPHCFLRHQEQFSLYALYSKNKPKSDALLATHGHAFFRWKQLELGDKMDLSSYLLKPIQRMSKYALLLTDLIKEVGVAQEAELTALQDATNMVKFQLRHGNDLLAMDAIRDCDVNLKEQGQLIRQDEFTVWSGRRKCQRHIFLFEDLVLFSKPKKMEGGLDVFIYKHSFKTADVGLTESSGDNGLRFEIWFRRRTTKNQTFILQAATADIKHAWTSDIARILWTQATRNKEMRLKEMVSMGVGNKPFLDIQPSDAAISDRAVHCIMKTRGARTRASIAVSVFDHAHPFKRGAPEAAASGPSSSSLLGPLNLHMFSQSLPSAPPADASFSSSCIEEDEQEHETSSQPSMTTESSGSSSRCLSGSTGSDSGCVSSHLQEALQEEPGPRCQLPSSSSSSSSTNKQHRNDDFISPKSATVV